MFWLLFLKRNEEMRQNSFPLMSCIKLMSLIVGSDLYVRGYGSNLYLQKSLIRSGVMNYNPTKFQISPMSWFCRSDFIHSLAKPEETNTFFNLAQKNF
jgi:hypothetical protein